MAQQPPIEEYVQIYTEYHVWYWSAWEISQKHNCSDDKVWDALNYVNKLVVKLPQEAMLKGAVMAVKARLRANNEELGKLRKKNETDGRSYPLIIGLNREIRADEQLLYNLLGLLSNDTYTKNLKSNFSKEEELFEKRGSNIYLYFLKRAREQAGDEKDIDKIISTLEQENITK